MGRGRRRLEMLLERLPGREPERLGLEKRSTSTDNLRDHAAGAVGPIAQGKNLELPTEAPRGMSDVVGDEQLPETAFVEILERAVRLAPDGGRVVLGAQEGPGWLTFRISHTSPGVSLQGETRGTGENSGAEAPPGAWQPGS